jgi:hypothetical protein
MQEECIYLALENKKFVIQSYTVNNKVHLIMCAFVQSAQAY